MVTRAQLQYTGYIGGIDMGKVLTTLAAIVIVLLIVSGLFTLIGAVFSLTFGIISVIMSMVWKILFSPLGLIVIVVYIIYRVNRKS